VLAGTVCFVLSGCAQKEPEQPRVYAEPTFDKYGHASCRPSGQPVDSVYTADIPPCDESDDCGPGASTPGTAPTVDCIPPRVPDTSGGRDNNDRDTGRTAGR